MKLKNFALSLLMLPLMSLTSCVDDSQKNVSSLNIYQPRILNLKGGTPIQTVDGVYTPQLNETWHSDASYRKLERELLYP